MKKYRDSIDEKENCDELKFKNKTYGNIKKELVITNIYTF
jgi:hypothetical protein